MNDLSNKKNILLGITGGIAAYKIPLLVRLLVQNNFNVKVIVTDDAQHFVTTESLSVLSKNPVLTSFFNEKNEWNNHVHLADWADILVIAPATANTIAKIANGYCDNLLMATYLSFTKNVLIAPAMDAEMWENNTVQQNIEKIKQKKQHIVLPVEYGELASGIKGWGRMSEPGDIFKYIEKIIFKSEELQGKKVLVTAGATYEPIDPVRFIGNRSSGKTGIAIAEELYGRGAEVFLVYGQVTAKLPHFQGIHKMHAETAQEMFEQCVQIFPEMDIAILSAAVADYTPVLTNKEKIKKSDETFVLKLQKTKDILKALGEQKQKHQLVIGFALETENLIENAKKKLLNKNADLIFANWCSADNPAFNEDINELTAIFKDGETSNLGTCKKTVLAEKIVDIVTDNLFKKQK